MPPRRKFSDSEAVKLFKEHEAGKSFWRLSSIYNASPECIRRACLYVARMYGVRMRGRRAYRPKREITTYLLVCVKEGWIPIGEAARMTGKKVSEIRAELTKK